MGWNHREPTSKALAQSFPFGQTLVDVVHANDRFMHRHLAQRQPVQMHDEIARTRNSASGIGAPGRRRGEGRWKGSRGLTCQRVQPCNTNISRLKGGYS